MSPSSAEGATKMQRNTKGPVAMRLAAALFMLSAFLLTIAGVAGYLIPRP
jgi:hypothetical protein